MPEVIDSYEYIQIVRSEKHELPIYMVKEPELSPEERAIVDIHREGRLPE